MPKHRVFSTADNAVAVMTFAVDDPKIIERDTQTFLERNPGSSFTDTDEIVIPASRRKFRNCWTMANGTIAVALGKARGQLLGEIRTERDKRLANTDGLVLRAQDHGNNADLAKLRAHRQKLRDLPITVQAQLDALDHDALLADFQVEWPVDP